MLQIINADSNPKRNPKMRADQEKIKKKKAVFKSDPENDKILCFKIHTP